MAKDLPKVAVVTGGSRGIGAACSRLLAKHDYAVSVNYHSNRIAAEAIVDDIRKHGGSANAVQGDIGSPADILKIFEETDHTLGRVTALINNAGIVDVTANVTDMTFERLERMMRINVIGSFLCAAEAIKRMSTKKGGKGGAIVNISSIAATLGSPAQYVDYAASKGAIDTFTKGLALEVAAEGIRVNAVRPGIIETEIHASGGIPDRVEQLKNTVPLKRGGTAEEIAHAVLHLLSNQSSYTTGALLDVSGGR